MSKFLFHVLATTLVTLSFSPLTANAEAKVGERFGDWIFECKAIAEGKTNCALAQTLIDKDSKRPVAKFSVGKKNDGKKTFTALLPLGTYLPTGASAKIDQGSPFNLLLKVCTPQGCIAQIDMDSSMTKNLQNGQAFNLSFALGDAKNTINLTGSLKGLADGMKAANFN
jgi:invasion protein IalB